MAPAIVALMLLGSPLAAQETRSGAGTRAREGLALGAFIGGALGGIVGYGFVCEGGSSCDRDRSQWMLAGLALGVGIGGLTGLVIGAALPEGEPDGDPGTKVPPPPSTDEPRSVSPRTPWSVSLSLGGSRGAGAELGNADFWVAATVLRPTDTDSRVRWGFEVAHLGTRSLSWRSSVDTSAVANEQEVETWSGSLVALRTLGGAPAPRAYLMASAGAYPRQRTVSYPASGLRPPNTAWEWHPGAGAGAGGRWWLGEGIALGLESRLHLLLGVGDTVSPLATLGGTVQLGR